MNILILWIADLFSDTLILMLDSRSKGDDEPELSIGK